METVGRSEGGGPTISNGFSMSKPRVCILSDVRLYREALLWSLHRLDAFEMVGAADLSSPAVTSVIGLQPDSIILDVGAVESFVAIKHLGISLPKVKIVGFAVSEIDHLVLACAEAGIAGFVGRDGSEQDIVTAVECALRGELYCSSRIAGVLARHIAGTTGSSSRSEDLAPLTRRELQVFDFLVEGKSNKEIGRVLHVAESTVKNHVHNILEKLQVHRRAEAVARSRNR